MLSCIQTSLLAFSKHCERKMQVHGRLIFFAVLVATILWMAFRSQQLATTPEPFAHVCPH